MNLQTGQLTVCTTGTFDIPHIGHANFLRQAAQLGDLWVGVLSDEFVLSYKGHQPVFTEAERCKLIQQLGYRADVVDVQGQFFRALKADIVAVGDDWRPLSRYEGQVQVPQGWFDENGISVVFIPYTTGISTAGIKSRLVKGE